MAGAGYAAPQGVTYEARPARIKPPALEYIPGPTLQEMKIYSALAQETDLQFANTPLTDVTDFVAEQARDSGQAR